MLRALSLIITLCTLWVTPQAQALDITGPELDRLLLEAYRTETDLKGIPAGYELDVNHVGRASEGGEIYLAGYRKINGTRYTPLLYPQYFFRVFKIKRGFDAESWYPKMPKAKYAMVDRKVLIDGEIDTMHTDHAESAYLVPVTDSAVQAQALMGIMGLNRTLHFPPLLLKSYTRSPNAGANLPWLDWQATEGVFELASDTYLKGRSHADVIVALYDDDFKQISGKVTFDYAGMANLLRQTPRPVGSSVVWDYFKRQVEGKPQVNFANLARSNRLRLEYAGKTEEVVIKQIQTYPTNGYKYVVSIELENRAQLQLWLPNSFDYQQTPNLSIDDLRSDFQQTDSPLSTWGYHEPWTMLEWVQPLDLNQGGRGQLPPSKHAKITDADFKFTDLGNQEIGVQMRAQFWMKRQGDHWGSSFKGDAGATLVNLEFHTTTAQKILNPCNKHYEYQVR